MNFCTSLGKRLCHSTDLCTTDSEGGQHFIPDVVPNDNWVPISDESNEWLQNGDSAGEFYTIGMSHHEINVNQFCS